MCLGDHVGGIRADALCLGQGKVAQKFDITLGTLHGREGQSKDGEAKFISQGNKGIQDLFMCLWLPDNPLFAHLFLPCFKLRLDQAKDLALSGLQELLDGGQNDLQ